MISFQTWLPQILGYARFLADSDAVQRAWIGGDLSQTSVSDFDELYEQIFDDLDSESFLGHLALYMPSEDGAQDLIRRFLSQIEAMDAACATNKRMASAAHLLRSLEWSRVVEAARALSALDQQKLLARAARAGEPDR